MDTVEERAHQLVSRLFSFEPGAVLLKEDVDVVKEALQAERDEGYKAGQSDVKEENRRLKEELQDLHEEMEEEVSEAVHLLKRPSFSAASFIKKHSGKT